MTRDWLQYIPMEKHRIPYSTDVRIEGVTFTFTYNYNSTGDFFTVDLSRGGEILTRGEKIVYNQPLFLGHLTPRHPRIPIIPFGVSGTHQRVGWDELDNDVRLYLFDSGVLPDVE